MEESSSQNTSQPFRASSEGPTPPVRSFQEDGDASVTRKRPRLDSGNTVHRSLSAGRASSNISALDVLRALREQITDIPLADSLMYNGSNPHITSPSSKVTLNIKGQPIASDGQDDVVDMEIPDSQESVHTREMTPPPQKVPTPLGSPEIEVAEPEDSLGHVGPTRWKKPGGKTLDERRSELFETFPLLLDHEDFRATVLKIGMTFEYDQLDCGVLLNQLSDWLDNWIKLADSCPDKIYEVWSPDTDVWTNLPDILIFMSKRTIPACVLRTPTQAMMSNEIDLTEDDNESVSIYETHQRNDNDPVLRFFKTIIALVCRMIRMDCQTLMETFADTAEPDVGGKIWIQHVNYHLLNKDNMGHITQVYSNRRWTIKDLRNAVMMEIVSSDGVGSIIECIRILLNRTPADFEYATSLIAVIADVATWTCQIDNRYIDLIQSNYKAIRSLFAKCQEKFEELIKKQVSGFGIEAIVLYIQYLAEIMKRLYQLNKNQTLQLLPTNFEEYLQEYLPADNPNQRIAAELNCVKYKSEAALLCMRSGRMETRIAGVECLNKSLTALYDRHYHQREEHDPIHPTIAYCRNFIGEKNLISYLVGVDSHPRVISRCANIVAFQLVTNCYGQKETDILWDAMTSSQDPRRSEAILTILSTMIKYADTEFLQTFVQKLGDLPLEAYDTKMSGFVTELLSGNVAKDLDQLQDFLEAMCFNVFVRILRECLGRVDLSIQQKRQLWTFASDELRKMINHHLPDDVKSQLSQQGMAMIEEGDSASTAGIAIWGMLIGSMYAGHDIDGDALFKTDKFAELIVQDFSSCPAIMQHTNLDEQYTTDILRPRIELVQQALIVIPSWPSKPFELKLWQNLVGHGALNSRARDLGYVMLTKVTKHAMDPSRLQRITFLDACALEYIQTLESSHMTTPILEFATRLTIYQGFLLQSSFGDSEEDMQSLPGDMFWHIALKASDQDIVDRAIGLFVDFSLASRRNISTHDMEIIHVRLVDRCIARLIAAAGTIEKSASAIKLEDMMVTGSELTVMEPTSSVSKFEFSRSLQMLKLFLDQIRETRLGSPITRNASPLSDHSIHGEELNLTFNVNGEKTNQVRTLVVGSEDTISDLEGRLCKATGSSKINIFVGGQRLDARKDGELRLNSITVFESAKHLLIQKAPGAQQLKEDQSNRKMLPLEQRVMVHFDKLYHLLDLKDEMAKEVCHFLMTFPPKSDVLESSNADNLLPLSSPYKSIYCCYVLKNKLLQSISEGASCEDDLQYIVRGIGKALSVQMSTSAPYLTAPMDTMLTYMTDCLLVALKESVSTEISASYFPDAEGFVTCVLSLLTTAVRDDSTKDRTAIITSCFAIVLEASLKESEVWEALQARNNLVDILSALWLESPKFSVRSITVQTVKGICAALPLLKNFDSAEFLDFFWEKIVLLIDRVEKHAGKAKNFFDVGLTVFRAKHEHGRSEIPLEEYVKQWSVILLDHEPQESVSDHDGDSLVDGMTDMLLWCIQYINSKKQNLDGTQDLLAKIFHRHLFPRTRDPDTQQMPILSSSTRAKLYTLVLSLATTQSAYQLLSGLIQSVVESVRDVTGAWSNGVAQLEPERGDTSWMIERENLARAKTGYAGLKNLSNTCYLNSLFEQLFMNIRFRDFMMQASLVNREASQPLITEVSKLFGYLQETWLKCVDTRTIVDNLITYDGDPIDIHVQMDVDEFYNLLFDRLETQLSTAEEKKQFRQFYGGELVQQIKSQDCPHVSERFEPFSVIQCEIQGKSNLTESLDAFIEGEMMQGDNKYKCSTCDTYVNAVKRACLKQVPDNLIFHLKRFDFDLVNGTRHKINDEFAFPTEIDMAPYNVEYLKDTRVVPEPDNFMLVGVLVHSGTADTGHYYSFIRERPGMKQSWVEMNDSEVTPFDPAAIGPTCFGGWDNQYQPPYLKPYSAYMLFYQRIEAMKADAESYPTELNQAVRTHLPQDLQTRLMGENEHWIRKYCLLDPSYVRFSRDVLEKHTALFTPSCSDDHKLEDQLVRSTMIQLEHTFARMKECKYLNELLHSLSKMLRKCVRCAYAFIQSILSDTTFRSLVLRTPNDTIRATMADEIFHALTIIEEKEPNWYRAGDSPRSNVSASSDEDFEISGGIFQEVLAVCDQVVDSIFLLTKGWNDFWAFMCRLAERGQWESSKIHASGYFYRVLTMIIYNGGLSSQEGWTYANLWIKYQARNRKYTMDNVAKLAARLFHEGTASMRDDRDEHEHLQITDLEHRILVHSMPVGEVKNRSVNVLLLGFFTLEIKQTALHEDMMRSMMLYNNEPGTLRVYQNTLLRGTSAVPATAAEPFLVATLAFIGMSPSTKLDQMLIQEYAKSVPSIDDQAGAEHLRFFNSVRWGHHLNHKKTSELKQIIASVTHLFAPHLLCYHEHEVRRGTATLVQALLTGVDLEEMEDDDTTEAFEGYGKELTKTCLLRLQTILEAKKPFSIKRLDELVDVIRASLDKFWNHYHDNEEATDLQERFDGCLESLPRIAADSPDAADSAEYSDSELTDDSLVGV